MSVACIRYKIHNQYNKYYYFQEKVIKQFVLDNKLLLLPCVHAQGVK